MDFSLRKKRILFEKLFQSTQMNQESFDKDEAESVHRAGEVFLTNLSRSPSPIQELGHQAVNPTWTEFARAACRGFFVGLSVRYRMNDLPWLESVIPASMAIDTLVSDYSKELSYDHEYAREVWEHEYNSIGEVDEYVAYATARGISEEKARNIALTVTSEPSVSVPYHLAFELGLIRPTSYRRKLQHAAAVGFGYYTGIVGSGIALSLTERVSSGVADNLHFRTCLIPVSLIILSPALFLRFKHISRVHGSREFKIITLASYVFALGVVIYISKSR
jgi:hypothetical protein